MRRKGSILLTTILICTAILTSVTVLTFGARFRIHGEGARRKFLQRELDENSVRILMEEYAMSCSSKVWDEMLESLKTREVTLSKTFIQNEYRNLFPKKEKDLSSLSLAEVMEVHSMSLQIKSIYPIEYKTYTLQKLSAFRMEYEATIKREEKEENIKGALIVIFPLSDMDDHFFDLAPGETNAELVDRIPKPNWKDHVKTVYYE